MPGSGQCQARDSARLGTVPGSGQCQARDSARLGTVPGSGQCHLASQIFGEGPWALCIPKELKCK